MDGSQFSSSVPFFFKEFEKVSDGCWRKQGGGYQLVREVGEEFLADFIDMETNFSPTFSRIAVASETVHYVSSQNIRVY